MTQPIFNHTAGPWKAFTVGSAIGIIPVNRGGKPRNGRSTDDVCSIDEESSCAEANAKLIVAAPAMLQALLDVQKAYQDMFDVMPVGWQTIDHIVCEAIAEATSR